MRWPRAPDYAAAVLELVCAECGRGEADVPGRMLIFRAVEADAIRSLLEQETYGLVVLCRPCAEREGMVERCAG